MISVQIHEMSAVAHSEPDREERFVSSVMQRCRQDKGYAARLRRADNPATEYQCWETLAAYGVNLEREQQRLPFVMVAAAIAKAKAERNGVLGLGSAIAACYKDKQSDEQGKARLRRLLACDDLHELCRILRPQLSLIESRAGQPLDFARLLRQLLRFSFSPQKIKAQWAQEFYGQAAAASTEENA